MNAADVVRLLSAGGIKRSESSIKYIAHKYDLYNSRELSIRSGLDPCKIKKLVGALTSPLRVAAIAHNASVSYSKVNYYIMKYKIPTVKIYGTILLKNKKDLDYVKSFL